MGGRGNPGLVVLIALIIISIIIIIGILVFWNCNQWKEGFNRLKRDNANTKNMDIINKDGKKAVALGDKGETVGPTDANGGEINSTDARIEEAQRNKVKNSTKPGTIEMESLPGTNMDSRRDFPVKEMKEQHKDKKNVRIVGGVKPKTAFYESDEKMIYADDIFDTFTPKENTMELYGVTPEQLKAMVREYRAEHKYEVPTAPSTLTFNINRWEKAQDKMRDEHTYTPARRDEDFGLVYSILDNEDKDNDGIESDKLVPIHAPMSS